MKAPNEEIYQQICDFLLTAKTVAVAVGLLLTVHETFSRRVWKSPFSFTVLWLQSLAEERPARLMKA